MTQLTIMCFGMLTEVLGNHTVDVEMVSNTDELLLTLKQRFPKLNNLTFGIALNKTIVTESTPLKIGDEIALLPPFSGG